MTWYDDFVCHSYFSKCSFKDVISITSSSPTQTAPLSARATANSSSINTFSVFGLPTPQIVSHESKTRSRADSASQLHSVTESRSVALPFPQTPSRSKTKFDIDHTTHTPRTTPHSQRIVPSSQYFADEQASLASSPERTVDGRDPFLPHQRRDPDEELTLPSLFKLPHPPMRAPTKYSSSSLPFASVSSNDCSSRHRSQNSQIVPTSQLDEVELRFSSDSQAIPLPVRSPLVKHDKISLSLKPYVRLVTHSNAVLVIHIDQVGAWTSTKPESSFQRQSYAGAVGRRPSHTSRPSFKPSDTSDTFLPPST